MGHTAAVSVLDQRGPSLIPDPPKPRRKVTAPSPARLAPKRRIIRAVGADARPGWATAERSAEGQQGSRPRDGSVRLRSSCAGSTSTVRRRGLDRGWVRNPRLAVRRPRPARAGARPPNAGSERDRRPPSLRRHVVGATEWAAAVAPHDHPVWACRALIRRCPRTSETATLSVSSATLRGSGCVGVWGYGLSVANEGRAEHDQQDAEREEPDVPRQR
jgi:hypothetical protein